MATPRIFRSNMPTDGQKVRNVRNTPPGEEFFPLELPIVFEDWARSWGIRRKSKAWKRAWAEFITKKANGFDLTDFGGFDVTAEFLNMLRSAGIRKVRAKMMDYNNKKAFLATGFNGVERYLLCEISQFKSPEGAINERKMIELLIGAFKTECAKRGIK